MKIKQLLYSKHFDKFMFVVEFLLSFLTTIFSYKYITNKAYNLESSNVFFILAIISAIIIFFIILLNFFKNKENVEKIFVSFIIPIGMLYLVYMLINNVPDEIVHVWKAYEVSEGILFTKIDNVGNSYTIVPQDLKNYTQNVLNKYNVLNDVIKSKTDYTNTVSLVSPAQGYIFILYIASSLGLFLARILNFNVFIGIFLGRIFNFIVFIFAGYYSIKKIPFGKIFLMIFLLIPMMLHQAVSFSGDSITNSSMVLYLSYTLYFAFKSSEAKIREKVLYLFLIIIICLSKIAYLPLLAVSFILLFRKNIIKKEKVFLIITSVVAIVLTLLLYKYQTQLPSESASNYMSDNNVNSSEQISFIINNPMEFCGNLFLNIKQNFRKYVTESIGAKMGWLNIIISEKLIHIYLLIIIFSLIIEKDDNELNLIQRIWFCLISIGTFLLILIGTYISWSTVGSKNFLGIQGRYFLPILLLLLINFVKKIKWIPTKQVYIMLPIAASIINLFVIKTIIQFFI